jgi:hypothetical protein
MNDLKSCPYCGDKYPRHITRKDFGCRGADYEVTYAIECEICGGRTKFFTRLSFAIDAWNKREYDDGNFLKLPCKIGDTVYEIYDVEHETCRGKCMTCNTDCSSYYTCWKTTYEWRVAEYEVNLHYLFHNWTLFGARVFLTREEAEKVAEEKNKEEQKWEKEYNRKNGW